MQAKTRHERLTDEQSIKEGSKQAKTNPSHFSFLPLRQEDRYLLGRRHNPALLLPTSMEMTMSISMRRSTSMA
jgi:hypothetical protein